MAKNILSYIYKKYIDFLRLSHSSGGIMYYSDKSAKSALASFRSAVVKPSEIFE